MFRRYGYSFKHDKDGADSSTNIRFMVVFVGVFVVMPLMFVGWLLTSPESSAGPGDVPSVNAGVTKVKSLVEFLPTAILALTILICSLLNY